MESRQEQVQESLPIIYFKAKKNLNAVVMAESQKMRIPFFLLESILADILSDVRKQATLELAAEEERYMSEKQKEYDTTINDLIKNFEKKGGDPHADC